MSPFLCTGVINACFHLLGNVPVSSERLKIFTRAGSISGEERQSSFLVTLSMP